MHLFLKHSRVEEIIIFLMSLSDKFILEKNSDAAIAQKGTAAEKAELRATLAKQLENYSVYGERTIESLWYSLEHMDLSDAEMRKDVSAFITAERTRNGGTAPSDIEQRFAILKRDLGLAEAVDQKTEAAKQAATAQAAQEASKVREDVQVTNLPKNTETLTDAQEQYNTRMIRSFSKRIKAVVVALEKSTDAHAKELATSIKQAQKNSDAITVIAMQTTLRDNWLYEDDSKIPVSLQGNPDGFFGPLTMEGLEVAAEMYTANATSTAPTAPAPSSGPSKPANGAAPAPASGSKPAATPVT